MEALTDPTLAAAGAFLSTHLRGGKPPAGVLLVAGRCRVEYQGRTAAKSDQGDRIVLIKRDGALLLHGPVGVKPLNWQPPGATFDVKETDGELVLWARRSKPVEVLELRFREIFHLWARRLEDGAGLQVSGSEFDLRDLLRSRPELVEPGFRPWARERMTDQGPMDLYGEDAQGRRVVIEIKRVPAGLAEATQLWRYVETERKRRGATVRGILLAPRISPRALQMLHEHDLEFLSRRWDDGVTRAARQKSAPRQPSLASFSTPSSAQTGRH